jgi:hypothetical protein
MDRLARPIAILLFAAAAAASAAPRIDSVSPNQGPIAGGTVVTISGSGFAGASVTLDEKPIAPLSITDIQIQLSMPSHDNGYALIQVAAGGTSSAAEFLYIPPRLQDLPPGYITTVAGVGKYVRVGLPAIQAMIDPSDVTVAENGDVYFMEAAQSLLFRVDSGGILHHVGGTLSPFDPELVGDGGAALDAFFGFSRSVAIDAAGNAYITDSRARIRKVNAATGIVSTVAGTGQMGFSGDGGPAAQAQIGQPTHIACGPDGTLYFLDSLPVGGGTPRNLRVRRVSPSGIITTIAGNGSVGDDGDGGPALSASLNVGLDDLGDIVVDRAQNVFILEHDGQRIRRVDAQAGVIATFASLAFPPGDPRSPALNPAAIAVDGAGNVYAATSWNFLKFDPSGRLLDKWGGDVGFSEDGTPAREMKIGAMWGMAIAPNGDVVFSVGSTRRIRKIDAATQTLKTVAGIAPNAIGVPGDARGAVLGSPFGDLAVLPSGKLLYSDATERRIYRIDARSETIGVFAGTGTTDYGAYLEAPALQASVDATGLDVDAQGNVYLADAQTIRSIDPEGIVHRIAGLTAAETNNDNCGFSGDGGPAAAALLCQPWDVTLDRRGNLFIADTNNNRIRRVDAQSGIITTVAGSGPSNGLEGYGRGSFCGDGGPALAACLNTPIAVAVRDNGSMYIDDFYNGVKIRKVDSEGIVSTLPWPGLINLIVGPGQSVFGYGSSSIYRADHDETRELIGGPIGFAGDGGPASRARMSAGSGGLARGMAIDAEGNLFFQDGGNYRIRAIRYGAVLSPPSPQVTSSPSSAQTTPIAESFGMPMEVTVRTSSGSLAPGVRVDFAAPFSGPSCVFENHSRTISVLTGADGKASAPCRATCQPGSYLVTATPLASGHSVSFSLTNTAAPLGTLPTLLCLDDQPRDDRFEVEMSYHTAQGGGLQGPGEAISLSSLGVSHGGMFWFFSANNPEVLLKVLNGCGVNSKYWVFSSAGTNVGLDTTVTDTFTGRQKVYSNPDLTAAAPLQDTDAFPCEASATAASLGPAGSAAFREGSVNSRAALCDSVFDALGREKIWPSGGPGDDPIIMAAAASRWNAAPAEGPSSLSLAAPLVSSACVTDETTLCIDSRFRVTIDYQTVQAGGLSGKAHVIPLGSLGVTSGGLFWFFSADNPELLVKVLGGCAVNDKQWVFYAAGTNLGLTVTVTDTQTGETKTYTNPDLSPAPPVQDVNAFACL